MKFHWLLSGNFILHPGSLRLPIVWCFRDHRDVPYRFFVTQKRIITYILKLQLQLSCKEDLTRLEYLTASSLHFLSLVVFVRKHLNLLSWNVHLYTENVVTIEIRGTENLSVPYHISTYFKKAPLYMTVEAYNMLSKDIKRENNFISLKKTINNYLLSMCLYNFTLDFDVQI